MDYHSIHGQDISSFDIPDTHRLPTIAASQALDELKHEPALALSTGLETLDKALGASASIVSAGSSHRGGVKRGQVTELWGPPGTGKTALAIQTTAHAICQGHDVVWVDCFQRVDKQRLISVVESAKRSRDQHLSHPGSAIDWRKFTHFSCLTLPHLMALISRPTPKSIGPGVSLVVVSSVSSLLNSAFPKSQDGKTAPKAGKGLTASAKRVQGLQFVINALQKLAATRNCAVMILSQCATRMQSEQGATLVAAVNALVWEQGVATRLVLFRDWAWQGKQLGSVFMAGLQKLDGKAANDVVERIAAFNVEPSGAAEIDYDAAGSLAAGPADLVLRKRKLGQTELEVPDSEDEADDEDYGWADEDEAALPAPPPQWQGSEDILLGQEVGRSDEGNDEDPDEGPDQDTA
ncbi:rad51 domain-containing protein [Hirsutella rhossiliensis]|uniref:Rad51 domain-containing protein n=1 Tax=Hirsutella rhossiliensis TaxID=111463 RepID=A0A9P8N2L4_9HYPO|nr:rad51 domain-containing protein [Hirsutella rhossiliensis]KAH0965777.1 rad51 domain-containing protein [Hirsutella rhossiliensis]